MSIASKLMKSLPAAAAVSSRALAVFVVLAVVPVAGWAEPLAAQGPRQQGTTTAAPVVGVIDVGKAVDQYKVHIDLRAKLKERYETYQEQLKGLTNQISELRVTIQNIDQGVPERAVAENDLKIGMQNLDFRTKYFNDLLATEELRLMLRVYEDVDFAVTKVAEKNGVSLVLPIREIQPSATPIADLPIREVEERVGAYSRRPIWFAAKELDLTDAVIRYMLTPLPNRNAAERAPAKKGD